ncbi:hypothetical protein ASZ90_005445 [hydrocarbon metagenome]|uniref:Dockerin domain-containing protein n=1 Tax=hydrocarbon metagenome TaxID=938273 RepID=A0A0W8FUW8_9ZZZZ
MNRFLRNGFHTALIFVMLSGVFFINIIAEEYTGRGVPVIASTGLPSATFPIVSDGVVYSVVPVPAGAGGGWFIGGSFTTVGGQSRNAVARINSNGTLNDWNPNINSGGVVYSMAVSGTTRLYIAGSFTNVGDSLRNNVAALNIPDAAPLGWYLDNGANGTVYAIVLTYTNNVAIGGDFTYEVATETDTTTYHNLMHINAAGTAARGIGAPEATNGPVYALAYLSTSTSLIVGGEFTSVNHLFGTEVRNNVTRFFRDVDFGWLLDTGWNPGANAPVRAASIIYSEAEYGIHFVVGGDFTVIGGQARNHLARVLNDGSIHPWNPNIEGSDPTVYSLFWPYASSILYVGGKFSTIGSETRNNLAVVSVSTGTPTAFNPYPHDAVRALAATTSVAYVGGEFDYMGEPSSRLLFTSDSHIRLDNSTYTDTLRLVYYGSEGLNGLQFKLRSNPPDVLSTEILTITDVLKGSDIASANWNLDFEYITDPNGDYVNVLIYGQDSTTLAAGTYNDLVKFTYVTGDVDGIDTVRSHFRLEDIESSYINGDPAGVLGDDDQIVDVYGLPYYGDINMDGDVDIADLLLIRDYILERISFNAEQFDRADLAPWTAGNTMPTQDGKVNVQDLSLLQNIILTGQYPSDLLITPPFNNLFATNFINESDAATTVTLVVTNEGIDIRTSSDENIIGLQLELNGIENVNKDLVITTQLGNAFYHYNPSTLRTLFYDREGKIELAAGENNVGSIPFQITNPEDLIVSKIVLVNSNLEKIQNVSVKVSIVTDVQEELPAEYSLYQNYPNPFNPSTTIEFSLKQRGDVTIKIYNMLGQEVRRLLAGQLESGNHRVIWDGMNDAGMKLSSGTYIYKMISGEFVQSKKMILLK